MISQIPGWVTCETAFQRDDNADLLEWVRTETPPDAVIAKDGNVQLPEPGDSKDEARFGPLTQKILSERYAADVGDIEEKMRALGVSLVAVSNSDYEFRLRRLRPPSEDPAAKFARRKEFYDNLLRDGELLFERERGAVLYLHPGIRVYRLPATGK